MKSCPVLKQFAMQAFGRIEVQLHTFFISTLDWGEYSAPFTGRFIPGERVQRYPLDNSLGRPQSRSGRSGEEKKIPFSAGK
jgi:hypothetical protein